MRRVVCTALILGLLVFPLAPTKAGAVLVSSSTFASSTVSSTIAELNIWLQDKFGINLYQLITKAIDILIAFVKLVINVLLEILPRIKDFLSAY